MRFLLILALLLSTAYGKIYDCFLFFNEEEILDIRLHEMNNDVDKFVIVEAAYGFRGHPKPFNFERIKKRYASFLDKIIYIKLEEDIDTDNPWEREHWQRNQIMRGLKDCTAEDLILISDVDEFIPGSMIPFIYRESARFSRISFFHKMYRWYLNRAANDLNVWLGMTALRYKHLLKISPQIARDIKDKGAYTLQSGWHFSSMGGHEIAREKYIHFSHGSDNPLTFQNWYNQATRSVLVEIDESFPQYVRDHIAYFIEANLIDPVAF